MMDHHLTRSLVDSAAVCQDVECDVSEHAQGYAAIARKGVAHYLCADALW